MIEITNRFTGEVIKTIEAENLRNANLRGANLYEADLRRADLYWADLSGANLSGANLSGANLRGADLPGADLARADLSGANLSRADLRGADLRNANLVGADLVGADLVGADLSGPDLYGANLSGADLSGAKNLDSARGLDDYKRDLWYVLFMAPNEVQGLLDAVRGGQIDGSQYEGECCCLKGTIANLRHCDYRRLSGIELDSNSPSERWFLLIKRGDTPASNAASAMAEKWILEWPGWAQIAAAPVATEEVAA